MNEPEHATDWKPIDDAAKNGTPVLLWARLKSDISGNCYQIVGLWQASVERWKASPEHLSRWEDLIPSYWMPLPEPPRTRGE